MEEDNTDLNLNQEFETFSSHSIKHETDSIYNFRKGSWLLCEHFRYLYASMNWGSDMKKMQDHIKTRSNQQIRSHSQKYISRIKEIRNKNCPQTMEEYRCKQFSDYTHKLLATHLLIILSWIRKLATTCKYFIL